MNTDDLDELAMFAAELRTRFRQAQTRARLWNPNPCPTSWAPTPTTRRPAP